VIEIVGSWEGGRSAVRKILVPLDDWILSERVLRFAG
jgi:hypothetical protein